MKKPPDRLKKIIAGYSAATLLATVLSAPGCSGEKTVKEEPEAVTSTEKPEVNSDEEAESTFKPNGKETKIRGKSG